MHKRSLLIGVGIGIIIGVLLLQLFNIGSESQQKLDRISNQINDTGLIHTSEVPYEFVEGARDEQESISSESSIIQNDPLLEQPTNSEPAIEEPTPTPEPSLEPAPESTESAHRYILRVPPGGTVSNTAKLLVEYQIIKDADSFAALLKEHKTLIRAGYFLVGEGSTNEEIRELLTGIPLTAEQRTAYTDDENLKIIQ